MLVHYVRKTSGSAYVKRESLNDTSCLLYALSEVEDISDIDEIREDLAILSKNLRAVAERKVGTLVAFKEDDTVLVGYSKFATIDEWEGVPFTKKNAREYAEGRARAYETRYVNGRVPVLPSCIAKELPLFLMRCKSYFKTVQFSPWVLAWVEKNRMSYLLEESEETENDA